MYLCIWEISVLTFLSQLCLGSLASAKAHIDGMVVLLDQQRLQIHEQPDPYKFEGAEEYQQDEELTNRYFLLYVFYPDNAPNGHWTFNKQMLFSHMRCVLIME
jgi:hypothetical protein